MDILIHIPNEDIPTKQDMVDISLHFIDGHVSSCTYPFEELENAGAKVDILHSSQTDSKIGD